MRLYIITGGPGSGKTTLMQELENRKKYMIVKESAKDVILEQQAKGIEEPWLELDFQEKVTELQLKRETALPAGNGIVFLDRGLPDGLAYCKFRNQKVPRNLYLAMKACDYEKVFFLEPLPNYEKSSFRVENEEDAKTIADLIKQTYTQLGYEIIDVPVMDVAKRADFVLQHL
jgi:predicted ATPase